MIECPMPQNVFKRKAKFIGPFSMRETISIFAAICLAIITYMFCQPYNINKNLKIFMAAIPAVISLVIGFLKIYNQYLEVMLPVYIKERILSPSIRRKEIKSSAYEDYRKSLLPTGKIKTSNQYKKIK